MKVSDNQIELYDGFTLEHEGTRITINTDDADNPRDWDNLSTLICFHRRYNLGDNQEKLDFRYGADDFSNWAEMKAQIENDYKPLVILPLFLYDHSGITMYTSPDDGSVPLVHRDWDSMQVGWGFVTPESVEEMGLDPQDKKQLMESLRAEIKTYDQYLTGDVYRYTIEKKETCNLGHDHHEFIDSCGGFYDKESLLEYLNGNFEEGK